MGSESPELESGRPDIGSDMPILRSERSDRSDFGSESTDLSGQGLYLRSLDHLGRSSEVKE